MSSAQPDRAPCPSWATVSACLQHDHSLMDAILSDVDASVREGNRRLSAEYFAHFRARLATHMELEEAVVFPLFEQSTGVNGPTTVMRHEHEMIRGLVDALTGALSAGDETIGPLPLLEELGRVLDAHDTKEERVIYPAVDSGVGRTGELPELVARIEAFLERGRATR